MRQSPPDPPDPPDAPDPLEPSEPPHPSEAAVPPTAQGSSPTGVDPDATTQFAPPPPTHLAAGVRELGLDAIESLTPGMPSMSPAQMAAKVGSIPAANRHNQWARMHAFNWRLAVMRLLSSALAVILTVTVVPGLNLSRWYWGSLLLIGLIFGLLNAIVKPVLQFLVLRFIFSTYGMVVVAINAFLLWTLDQLTDGLIEIDGLLPALVGGVGVGVFGLVFETLLGANPPILDSRRIEEATTS